MPIAIKLIVDITCGALFALGGWRFLWMRRYAMPSLLAIAFSFLTGIYWFGVLALPSIGTLCLGYFSRQWLGRGSWLALQGLTLGAGSVLCGHLSWYVCLLYVLAGFELGALLYDWEQVIGDIIFGIWLGSIIFFIH